MSMRRRDFSVEVKRKPGAGYASQPGDTRRSGRVDRTGQAVVNVKFDDRGSRIDARLGVLTVGTVTHDPASKGYFWLVDLPGLRKAPLPARDADKARDAVEHKIKEWCEAAGLISARSSR